jgi:hypothetical protein
VFVVGDVHDAEPANLRDLHGTAVPIIAAVLNVNLIDSPLMSCTDDFPAVNRWPQLKLLKRLHSKAGPVASFIILILMIATSVTAPTTMHCKCQATCIVVAVEKLIETKILQPGLNRAEEVSLLPNLAGTYQTAASSCLQASPAVCCVVLKRKRARI